MDYSFRTLVDAFKRPDVGFVPDSREDSVERSGYRSTDQMVREMVLAGERLEDWRRAAYSVDDEFLDVTPVFGDRVELEDRYRFLQEARARRKAALEVDELNARQVEQDALLAQAQADAAELLAFRAARREALST
ncbi:MAG: hypothetical protein [Microvirus sp.]|nr:MAG: hypothetical protein [Microvirus sp.]